MPRSWPFVLAALASCAGWSPRPRLDPARFAARAEWTPAAYAIGAAPAPDPRGAIRRDDAIADVAYLDHALDLAWPDASDALGLIVRARARDAPLEARTRAGLCDELARQMHDTSLRFAIAGHACGGPPPAPPIEPLATIPAGRNYAWRIDRAPGPAGTPDTEVAVLAIARFAAPDDPGWDGLAGTLDELATRDLVVLDLQDARGDDPRVGFAILAALGHTDTSNLGWDAPQASDSALAQVARANLAARGPRPAPRSRALWASFGARPDLRALAGALARERHLRLAMLAVIVGPGCESACGAIATVAHLGTTAVPLPRVDLLGGSAPDARGDELGVIRLPHSGVEVAFPTATYGPSLGASSLGGSPTPGFARAELDAMHRIAETRDEERRWNAQPVPACASLAPDPEALRQKAGGCVPSWVATGGPAATATSPAVVDLPFDATRAAQFLDGCPEVTHTLVVHDDLRGGSIVFVEASVAGLERLASAPFVRRLQWDCPAHID